jgi:hypothetical protein
MNVKQLTQEVLAAVQGMNKIDVPDMAKGFSQATGLVAYDLQPVALALYPFYPALTPLRNRIPRVGGGKGTATNWKAITGINTGNISMGITEGQRNASIATTVADKTAAYKGIGLDDFVTFEADYADNGFDDAKARAVQGLLRSMFLGEEKLLLAGNNSLALGTTGTPSLSASGSGATLPAATYSVIAVALTLDGVKRASLASGLVQSYVRTNMDGTSDTINGGVAQKSAAATQAVTLGQALFASCAVKNGAVAYAWFVGTAGSERLEAITTINSVKLSAALAGAGQLASTLVAADRSQDSLVFDGLTTQIWTPGSGAYVANQATGVAGTGTPLTADNGRIVEIENALLSFWDNYKLSPDTMYMSARTSMHMAKIVIANGGSAIVRLHGDTSNGVGNMTAGARIKSYLNPITNTEVNVVIHPDMADGQIMFFSESVPYQLSGVGNVVQVKTRQDYYQLEWPLRTRRYEYGVYADQLLQNYFPPAFGIIGNIATQ